MVSGLGQHWGTEAANSLRESTKIQWQCLKDKSKDKTVCPVWKKCLEKGDDSGLRKELAEVRKMAERLVAMADSPEKEKLRMSWRNVSRRSGSSPSWT